jgi:hypothetical protein
VAAVHARLEFADEAFGWLVRAKEARVVDVLFLGIEPDFAVLVSDMRWEQFRKEVGFGTVGDPA